MLQWSFLSGSWDLGFFGLRRLESMRKQPGTSLPAQLPQGESGAWGRLTPQGLCRDVRTREDAQLCEGIGRTCGSSCPLLQMLPLWAWLWGLCAGTAAPLDCLLLQCHWGGCLFRGREIKILVMFLSWITESLFYYYLGSAYIVCILFGEYDMSEL